VTRKQHSPQLSLDPAVLNEPMYVLKRNDGKWVLVLDEGTQVFDTYEAARAAYQLWYLATTRSKK